jgi:hypothetical protein
MDRAAAKRALREIASQSGRRRAAPLLDDEQRSGTIVSIEVGREPLGTHGGATGGAMATDTVKRREDDEDDD